MKLITIFVIVIFLCGVPLFAQNGEIREISGTVELKRAGETAFVAARAGDPVARNTVVSTGFRSSALIQVGSSLITVRPLTRLSLAEISSSAGTETINVSLQTGRVRVDVKPPAGTRTAMEVRGPSATASVRGTSFEFDTHSLTVLEGNVAFFPNSDYQEKRDSTQGAQSSENAESSAGAETAQGSQADKAIIVRAGAVSEIKANGKVADSITLAKAALVPSIKVDINTDIKAVSIQETVAPKTTRPASLAKLKTGEVNVSFAIR